MLEIRLTATGYNHSQISPALFEPLGNTLVHVICEPPSRMSIDTLEDSICTYMSSLISCEVRTHHVTPSQELIHDANNVEYVREFIFQVYL